jgi:hypothetical protein
LDDSLQRGGYEAISTFHFGNPDFTNTEPFLHRWRGQIPFVALQDAHGIEPWWAAELTGGFRTVFLAEEPTWEGWRRALRENWVMAIRHDAVSGFQTWMHGGSDEVVNYVLEHARDWRWWDNDAIARPWVSIVPVRPEDIFEAERPERGLTLRVRCAWSCTVHGILKEPLVELTRLTVDGQPVDPQLATVKASRGNGLADRYHHVHRPEPRPGRHTATAEIKLLQDGSVASRTISFVV